MKVFFFLLFVGVGAHSFSQDKDHPMPFPDSCLFAPNLAVMECGWVCAYGTDQYRVQIACPIKDYKIQIFNRWGELMFESTDLEEAWNTNDVAPETYIWVVTGEMSGNGTPYAVRSMGNVTVLK